MGLNLESGPDFLVVYTDDVLVFSHTLKDHLEHLKIVLDRLVEMGQKLKNRKCHFICHSVEYLGTWSRQLVYNQTPRKCDNFLASVLTIVIS